MIQKKHLARLVVALIALSAVLGAAAPAAVAQSGPPSAPHNFYGAVTGTNGNAISGVTVTVTQASADYEVTATTDSNGEYSVDVNTTQVDTSKQVTISVGDKSTSRDVNTAEATEVNFQLDQQQTEAPSDGGDTGGNTGGNTGGSTGGQADSPADTPSDGDTPEPVSETANLDQDGAAQVQLSGVTGATSVSVTVPGVSGQATVEELPELPADVPAPAGQYISAVDISAPDPAEGESATVSISISQSRLDELGVSAEQLVIQHYRDGVWETLETGAETKNGEVVLSAETTGFSPFAVTTQEQAQVTTTAADTTAQPDETAEPATQATTTSPPSDDGGAGPLLIAGVIIVVLALVGGLYLTSSDK